MIRTFTVLVVAVLLSACGAPRIPVPDPTPLAAFDERVVLDSKWVSSEARVSSGRNPNFIALRPVLDEDRIFAATPSGAVVSLNRENGKLIWETVLSENIVSGAGAGDGVAVVVSDSGNVYALNAKDGQVLWEYKNPEVVFAPPLVYQDRVILRTIDGNLFAFSAQSGEFFWDAFYGQPEFLEFGSAAPVPYQNSVIIGNAEGRVIATEVNSGFEAWQVFLGSGVSRGELRSRESFPFIIDNNMVFSDLSRAIVVYSLSTGNVMWENVRNSGRNVVADRRAVYAHDRNSLVYALNRENGSVLWQQDALLYRGVNNLALVGGHLVVSDAQGYLHVLEQSTGEVIGRHRTGKKLPSDGFIADGNDLYVYYRLGVIEAFSLAGR